MGSLKEHEIRDEERFANIKDELRQIKTQMWITMGLTGILNVKELTPIVLQAWRALF